MASIAIRPALTGIWLPAQRTAGERPRSPKWSGTPEVFFDKAIDNSRLVKISDRRRNREMAGFAASLAVLFLLVMIYAWQHFSSVEYGYRIEALDQQRQALIEANRGLRLEQASLSDPQRIDSLARRMGLAAPEPSQMLPLEPDAATGSPLMAEASQIAVVTAAP
jgi:cell division protein FtsL